MTQICEEYFKLEKNPIVLTDIYHRQCTGSVASKTQCMVSFLFSWEIWDKTVITNTCCIWKNVSFFYLPHKEAQHLEEIRKFQQDAYEIGLPFFSPFMTQYIILGALAGRNTSPSHCVDKVPLNGAWSPSETRLYGEIEEAEDNRQ